MNMKTCSRCRLDKPADAYAPSAYARAGSWCRACQRDYYNAKRVARVSNGRCLHHNEPLSTASRCPRCEERHRESNLRNIYGITPAIYDAMLAAQGGVCKICKRPPTLPYNRSETAPRIRRLAVDHDHATGRIRGLLCSNCNIALGKAQDKPDRLVAMAEYLQPEPEYIGAGC